MGQGADHGLTPAEHALLMAATKDSLAAAGALGGSLGAGDDAIWGSVPSGATDMVPALVRVAAEPLPNGGARVHVRGTGREGLIKQRIGGKAVDRICEAIAG